jgi:hypothetical protein
MTVAAKICLALNQHDHVKLLLDMEAPNLTDTELPQFFTTLADAGVDLTRLTVCTGNIRESYQLVNINVVPQYMFELSVFQKACNQLPKFKKIKFHFGIMIGRCTLPRLELSSYLYSNYQEKTFQTFHWQPNNDYHRTHLDLELLIHYYGIDSVQYAEAVNLLQHAPLIKQSTKQYPIVHPENLYTACAWYPDFFVDIVCETWHTGDTFFLTEKFWRAVATRTPFIIQGPQWILQRLKQLGFQTFSRWWNEGYSEDPNYHNIIEIKQVIEYLSAKSIVELEHMYSEMTSVLDHNLQVLKDLKYEDFMKLREKQNA